MIAMAAQMDTQNVTLRLPKALLRKAKLVATERGTTLTGLVIEGLTRTTSGAEVYHEALERQRALMRAGYRLRGAGESLPPRDAVHER